MSRNGDSEELTPEERDAMRTVFDLDKPPLIACTGRYKTRAGYTVHITGLGRPEPYSCVGTLSISPDRTATPHMWAASGRYSASRPQHPWDIVEKL